MFRTCRPLCRRALPKGGPLPSALPTEFTGPAFCRWVVLRADSVSLLPERCPPRAHTRLIASLKADLLGADESALDLQFVLYATKHLNRFTVLRSA